MAGDGSPVIADILSRNLLQGQVFPAQNVAFAGSTGLKRIDVRSGYFVSPTSQIEPGVHIRGKLALEKIHHDAPGGRGLDIAGTNRRSGIENDHLLAIARRGCHGLLLSHDTWIACSAQSWRSKETGVVSSAGNPSVGEKTRSWRRSGCRPRAGRPLLAGYAQQFARTGHIDGVHLSGSFTPKPIIGCHMHMTASQPEMAWRSPSTCNKSPSDRFGRQSG